MGKETHSTTRSRHRLDSSGHNRTEDRVPRALWQMARASLMCGVSWGGFVSTRLALLGSRLRLASSWLHELFSLDRGNLGAVLSLGEQMTGAAEPSQAHAVNTVKVFPCITNTYIPLPKPVVWPSPRQWGRQGQSAHSDGGGCRHFSN